MYKPLFTKRQVLVFRQFGNKGWSLFSCLGREVVCSVLSVSTLTYASAESVCTRPVVADSVSVKSDTALTLEEVTVTGTRAPLTRSQAARMMTVVERSDIQQAPVQSVNDILKYAVGVDVRQRGPIGAQTDVSIRGGTHDQIIILLDGINICDPQTGHNTMDFPVQLSDIERIEVLEGPAGRAYGSSSLVGAINIVTKAASTIHAASASTVPAASASTVPSGFAAGTSADALLDLRLEGGSFGYANAAVRYSPSTSLLSNLSASYAHSDGYSRARSGALNTGYSGSKAFYQGGYADSHVKVYWHAGLTDKGWGSGTFYASPAWQADDQYEHTTKLFAAVQAQTTQGALHLQPAVYWNEYRDRYEGYRGRPDLMKYNYNRCDVYGLKLNSYFDWTAGRTAIGAELRNEDLVSGNLGEPLASPLHICGTDRDYTLGINRTNISIHAEHNVILRQLTVSAGFVAVNNSWADMGWRLYPGVDASLRLGSHWKLHASINTSLRMPSFTEMYYRLKGYAADPHLKPEEMRAMELGAAYSSTAMTFSTAVWHHHGRNMIDWLMDTSAGDQAVWQSVNHTRLNSYGVEASLSVNLPSVVSRRLPHSTLRLSYGYISQDKHEDPSIVSQYAMEYLRHKLVATLQTPLCRQLDLRLCLRWQDRVGSYTSFSGDVCDYRPYALADARLQWHAPHYNIYAEVNNLLDNRSYVDYGNVPQPGAWIVVGASWRIGSK